MADEETQRIAILLQARDRDFHRAMDRNNKLIARFGKQADRDVSRASRAIDSNLSKISNSIGGLAKGAVAGVFAGALAAVTTQLRATVSGIAAIGDEARRAGLDLDRFQELKFVAKQNRIGVDSLVDGMKELQLRADEFITTGTGAGADAFARLGLGAEYLKRRLEDPSELMLEIVDRLEGMDRAARIRIADEVFGGTGGERFVELIDQGDEGLRRTIERAHEVGAVMDQEMIEKAAELDRRFSEIAASLGAMFKTITVEGVSAVADFGDALEERRDEAEEIIDLYQRLRDAADQPLGNGSIENAGSQELIDAAENAYMLNVQYGILADRAELVAEALRGQAGALREAGYGEQATNLHRIAGELVAVSAGLREGGPEAQEMAERLTDVQGEAASAVDALQGIDGVNFFQVGLALQGLVGQLAAVAQQAVSTNAAVAALPSVPVPFDARRVSSYEDRLEPQLAPEPQVPATRPQARQAITLPPIIADGGGGSGGGSRGSGSGGGGGGGSAEKSDYQRELEATRESIAKLEAEAVELVAVAESGREVGDALAYARKRAELLYAAQASGQEITPALRAEIDALAESYSSAGDAADAAADRLDRINENAQRGADAMTDLFGGIIDGSTSARDALGQLLLQLAKVQMQRAATSAAGGGGAAGAIFGSIGSALSGRRATGGAVQAGQPYLINENTPRSEVMVPSQSGAVLNVPQAQAALRGAAGGQGGQSGTVELVLRAADGVTVETVQNTAGAMIRQNNAQRDAAFNGRARRAVQNPHED
ncbi:hypothetical protein [Pseudoroseicyclus aestuarii]|uniref:Tail length tape measure protein n=1 Tax=Pseudoroseicyclus aestuarii TaxID=1795041 RepID=A0A318SRE4_9RHOB|nr:hypothetical protein [Pseudoroseicyclus aestuarii]PYE80812.1 hypothetical protein DFP88_11122 [Pseudoroseicyclus aestuarii]